MDKREELWNKWQLIGKCVTDIGTVLQNMPPEGYGITDYVAFGSMAESTMKELEKLLGDTDMFVLNNG